MRRLSLPLLLLVLLGCGRSGSRDQVSATEGSVEEIDGMLIEVGGGMPERRVIPTGTIFVVHLEEQVGTGRNRVGDPFTAVLIDPIIDLADQVLLPHGALIRGRVTGISAPNHPSDTASIRLAFESVSFEGRSHPLQALVIEAHPEARARRTDRTTSTPARPEPKPEREPQRGKDEDPAEEVGYGKTTRGGAGGTRIELETPGADLLLPSGSLLTLRLIEPVEMEGVRR